MNRRMQTWPFVDRCHIAPQDEIRIRWNYPKGPIYVESSMPSSQTNPVSLTFQKKVQHTHKKWSRWRNQWARWPFLNDKSCNKIDNLIGPVHTGLLLITEDEQKLVMMVLPPKSVERCNMLLFWQWCGCVGFFEFGCLFCWLWDNPRIKNTVILQNKRHRGDTAILQNCISPKKSTSASASASASKWAEIVSLEQFFFWKKCIFVKIPELGRRSATILGRRGGSWDNFLGSILGPKFWGAAHRHRKNRGIPPLGALRGIYPPPEGVWSWDPP